MDLSTASVVAAAVAASASALVAVAALYVQERRARILLQIELIFKFNDRFNEEGFRCIRRSAASAVLKNAGDCRDVDEVLDFFETMGLMLRRRALDPEMVWSEFFYWIDGWWCAAQSDIQEVRADDDTIWEHFRHLRQEMTGVEKKRTGANDSDLVQSHEDMLAFLEDEQGPTTMPRKKKPVKSKMNSRPPGDKKPPEGPLQA